MLIFNSKVKILVKKEMRQKPEKEKSFGDIFFSKMNGKSHRKWKKTKKTF
jgi:predicted transcriptional regulator